MKPFEIECDSGDGTSTSVRVGESSRRTALVMDESVTFECCAMGGYEAHKVKVKPITSELADGRVVYVKVTNVLAGIHTIVYLKDRKTILNLAELLLNYLEDNPE